MHAAHGKTMRGAIDGITTASRQATPVVGRLTAGITRLGTLAGVATRAVEGLATATSSLSAGAVERVNAALVDQGSCARLRASANGLGASLAAVAWVSWLVGSGEGSDGLPGLAVALQRQAGGALRSMWTEATSLQVAIVRMRLNGLPDSDIVRVRAKAEEVARLKKSATKLRLGSDRVDPISERSSRQPCRFDSRTDKPIATHTDASSRVEQRLRSLAAGSGKSPSVTGFSNDRSERSSDHCRKLGSQHPRNLVGGRLEMLPRPGWTRLNDPTLRALPARL